MNKRIAFVAGVAVLAWAAMAPLAMGQNQPAAQTGLTTAEGIVMEVQGQRIKVRAADGRTQWYSTDIAVSQNAVGQKVRGRVDQAGDALRLSSTTFSSQ